MDEKQNIKRNKNEWMTGNCSLEKEYYGFKQLIVKEEVEKLIL